MFLPRVVNAVEQSRPLEAVEFRRDAMANLAWAIEHWVESAAGRPVDRLAGHGSAPVGTGATADGAWRYRLATEVPDPWVPLVPVRIKSDRPQVVLRRGTIAATDDGASPRSSATIGSPG